MSRKFVGSSSALIQILLILRFSGFKAFIIFRVHYALSAHASKLGTKEARSEEMARTRMQGDYSFQRSLEDQIWLLQQRTGVANQVKVKWLPGTIIIRNGRRLAEEVRGNTILVYAENRREAEELARHGFVEWLLNQHTKPYRNLINKLITLFEDLQYENKERIVDMLTNLL